MFLTPHHVLNNHRDLTTAYNYLSHKIFEEPEIVRSKVKLLAEWIRDANGCCVIHVGAGLSTAAGIRDFRGKRGVWTEMQKGTTAECKTQIKIEDSKIEAHGYKIDDGDANIKPFDETIPTYSHMAIKALCQHKLIKHIVSQNVDGLFLKADLNRKFISELHGNFYLDECTKCRSRFIRSTASATMRLQKSIIKCPRNNELTVCKGHLRDTILDWDSPIPYNELRVATSESKRNKLHICIGTSLQLRPSKDLVCKPSKSNKLAIINLQPTKYDQQADLVIHYFADDVMRELIDQLNIDVSSYDPKQDPTKNPQRIGSMWKKL